MATDARAWLHWGAQYLLGEKDDETFRVRVFGALAVGIVMGVFSALLWLASANLNGQFDWSLLQDRRILWPLLLAPAFFLGSELLPKRFRRTRFRQRGKPTRPPN